MIKPLYLIRFLVGLCLMYSQMATAQVPNSLDSVRVYLKTHTIQDTNHVRALMVLGRELHSVDKPDYAQADSVLQVAERLAIKLQYGSGLARVYTNRGSVYYLTDRPQLAADYFQKALTTAETYHLSIRFICGAISNVAAALSKLKQNEKVVSMLLHSLELQEQHNVQPRIAATYGSLGNALRELKKYKEAIAYYKQALALNQQDKNTTGVAIIENHLGICYDELKQYNLSLPYYKRALKHAKEVKFDLLQGDILVNIGSTLKLSGHPTDGIPYVRKSLAIEIAQANKEGMATAYSNLGEIYKELHDYKQAEENLKKALALAKERGDKEQIANYTQGLADLYGSMKNFQQAYAFQLERNKQIDSTTTIRTSSEVQRLIAKYETGKKEAQIKLLRQQTQIQQQQTERTRLLLIGAILLLLLGAMISVWLLNRSKLRRLEEAQKLRKQIAHDLHDEVGSTLSSISMLSGHTDTLLSQNQPESAQKMVQKIYGDARQILEAIDEIIWTINPGNDSLHRIALRLQEYAQPLMESKDIHFSFQIDPSLEQQPVPMEVRRNLYLIGKEAINNLVKYSQATQANLRFERKDNRLQVLIEDNGRGFVQDGVSTRNGQGSMKQRAEAMGGSLEVHSVPEQGTRLVLITALAG